MKETSNYLPLGNGVGCYDSEIIEINRSLWFVDRESCRTVYLGWDTVLYQIDLRDPLQLRYVAVALRRAKLAKQYEICAAFGISEVSLRRWKREFERSGMEGLKPKRSTGRPRSLGKAEEICIRRWFGEDVSNCEMARRLGVSEFCIRFTLRRLGLKRERLQASGELPLSSDESPDQAKGETSSAAVEGEELCPTVTEGEDVEEAWAPTPIESIDASVIAGNPLDRSFDRTMAALGLLDDAAPVFAAGHVRYGGALLTIPMLVASGALEIFERVYRSLGPAFYGLRTSVVCFFLLALLRIKRPEHIKEHSPQDLGRILGLDRAPEVKTLRRKLQQLADRRQGMELMRQLAEARVSRHPDLVGFLYVDGHVAQYHGKYDIAKGFITQRRLGTEAVTTTWVNDLSGDPLFMVPSEVNEGLTKTLEPVLEEVRGFVGPEREITVIFDRGGWSPKLFERLLAKKFHIITYRKGKWPCYPEDAFEEQTLERNGVTRTYRLHDEPSVDVGCTSSGRGENARHLYMRQVTWLRKNGHQTNVVTDRQDLPAALVLWAMSNRWREENFFKYGNTEFDLDGLLEYGVEALEGVEDRPNPERRALEKELRAAKSTLAKAEAKVGSTLVDNEESRRPTVRGLKIAISEDVREVKEARERVDHLKERIKELPARIPANDLSKLKPERRLIADCIKMLAYQTETELLVLLNGVYARCQDEGRTLLHAAFQSSAELTLDGNTLHVNLAPQSSPHRTRAIAELCESLNERQAVYPGTNLRLIFGTQDPQTDHLQAPACQEV